MSEAVQNCPKDVVIPMVLIPGIMGSRLRQADNPSRKAWDPDDTVFTLANYVAFHRDPDPDMARLASIQRKRLLVGGDTHSPGFLEPDDTFEQEGVDPAVVAERRRRGWGTVVRSFYMATITHLAGPFRADVATRVMQTNPEFNWLPSPVWAVGYNWTASNTISGEKAAEKIAEAKAEGDQIAAEEGATCPGVLVVTHSMGGFVARSAVLEHGAAGDVLAVLHNVMPTDGAPAAYKRFHFGFENPDGVGMPARHRLEAHIGYIALGRGGMWTNSTLGHSPGPQELLPNKRYSTNDHQALWMTIKDYDGTTYRRLPAGGDPYTEIYQNQDEIYRCANPEWLFPEGTGDMSSDVDTFSYFVVQNNVAKAFHDRIIGAGDYHDVTYFSHSGDPNEIAWDRITWSPEAVFDNVLGINLFGRNIGEENLSADRDREYQRENFTFGDEEDKELEGPFWGADWRIEPANSAGDSTVPISASYNIRGVPQSRRTVHNPGYEHGAAIANGNVLIWMEDCATEVLSNCALF